MTEINIGGPPTAACKLCSSFFTDRCPECIENGLDGFIPKKKITFEDLPPFPTREFINELPFTVRQALVAIYLEKIVELLR